eukprot:TRINITY_DN6084_c0_g2_i1.p1 TRINITY_DN6084_c0_g2~~TRINITY_DN6084_c0_g2_i1.p1  ORF type:complete len:287 (+),score=96.94 TRINITY_DN6084_c0_g2_i1:43-903(+)
MLRRQARLRREYLFRKNLEGKEKEAYEKKRKIRDALNNGTPVPTELREEALKLKKSIDKEDATREEVHSHMDDEYARAGVYDPKIFLTTSRDPSTKLQQFSKEMALILPNSIRTNRGGHLISELVAATQSNDCTDLVILHEHRGEPDAMVICHMPYGPTAYFSLANVIIRHDIPDKVPVSQQYPHLLFQNFSTPLGERVSNILKYLFPVPKEDSTRVMTFVNENDYISFRHHTFKKHRNDVDLTEIGPRFEMRLFQIKLGTVDMKDADNEFVLRPFMNTAKNKNYL